MARVGTQNIKRDDSANIYGSSTKKGPRHTLKNLNNFESSSDSESLSDSSSVPSSLFA